MRALLRLLRGPAWYVLNIAKACWRQDLRFMADKPGQKPWKRVCYRCVITVETLAESLFLFTVIATIGVTAATALPVRWAFLEIRDTWENCDEKADPGPGAGL